MSVQRRCGQKALLYPEILVTDERGNVMKGPDLDNPVEVRAAFSAQRGARAEVPGQVQVNVYRMLVDPDVEGIGLWGRVRWTAPDGAGPEWDIVSPPAYRHGTRHVRHVSFDIRERPNG